MFDRIFQLCFFVAVFIVLCNASKLNMSKHDTTWIIVIAIISFALVNTFYPTIAVPCNLHKYS